MAERLKCTAVTMAAGFELTRSTIAGKTVSLRETKYLAKFPMHSCIECSQLLRTTVQIYDVFIPAHPGKRTSKTTEAQRTLVRLWHKPFLKPHLLVRKFLVTLKNIPWFFLVNPSSAGSDTKKISLRVARDCLMKELNLQPYLHRVPVVLRFFAALYKFSCFPHFS